MKIFCLLIWPHQYYEWLFLTKWGHNQYKNTCDFQIYFKTRAEIQKKYFGFLVQMKALKFAFKIN